jgi:hypothetical protein
MAGQNYVWQVSKPSIGTGVGVISSAYNRDNTSPFTTITETNSSGYVDVFPDSTSTDFNIKNLQYAIQTDGKITYRVKDGTQNPRQYNSLQELADGRGSWNSTTSKQVQNKMNGILTSSAQSKGVTPTSPTPPVGDQVGSTTDPFTTNNLKTLEEGIPGRPPRLQYGNLYYPQDIGTSSSDVIKFTMIRYGVKTTQPNSFSLGERKLPQGETQIQGSVTMSIQPSIGDFNSVNWNGLEMGMLGMAAGSSVLETIDTGSISGSIDKLGNVAKLEGTALVNSAIAAAAQEATGTKGLLTRLTGAMFNNNLELLFQGPQLRQFTFTFKLSPRYQEESESVRKIIRFFKQGSAVQRSTTNLFLKSPNIFNIEYMNRGKTEHKSLNKIKTCALVSCSVDYTPTGSYMTYNDDDSSMVSYALSLTFNELEPIYEDEYDRDDSNGVGY